VLAGRLAPVLENDVAHRGVGGRNRVEAINLVDLVIERAAHDEPHHHLDALGSRLAHVLHMRNAAELLGILTEVVEEGLIEFAVDQTGAWPGDLM